MTQELQTLSFPVPSEDVGRLIGKHGIQIKSMREQSQCHITVESTDIPQVKLKGTPQSIAEAKRLIAGIIGGERIAFLRDVDESIMSTLTRDGWLQNKAAEYGVTTELKGRNMKIVAQDCSNPDSAQRFKSLLDQRISGQSELVEELIPVDTEGLRRIKEDSGIKQLESVHHLKMEVKKDDRGTQLVLRGQKGVLDEALKSVKAILESRQRRDFIRLTPKLFEGCPPKKMSDFKSDVREVVSQKFNVRVDLTPGATQAVIEGENINTAKEELELILQYYFNQNCAVLDIPIAAIPEICGEKDEKLVRFQNLQIQVTVDRVAGRLWICGLAKPADTAYKKFTSDIERWKSHNTEIPILESRHAGMLVGPRGENLRRMQEETGATITVKSLNDGSQAVHITGTTPEITQKGTKAVECCIHNADTRRPQQAPNNQCDPIGVSSRGKPQPYRNRY